MSREYTFYNFIDEVLTRVGKPLSAEDIWSLGCRFGLDKKLKSKGKTPEASVKAQIYSYIKKNGYTKYGMFKKNNHTRFYIKKSHLRSINNVIDINKVNKNFKIIRTKQDTGIFTPFELVEEILSKLPIDWSDPDTTFLDPACGRGTFLISIYNRLFDGLKDIIIDPVERKKHILNKQLFGVDIDPIAINIARSTLFESPNLFVGDSLEYNFNMKFDVVIGNPPFQSKTNSSTKLWVEFIIKSKEILKKDGIFSFILPPKWSELPSKKVNKKNKQINDFIFKNEILDYNFNIKKYFNVGSNFSYFIIKNNRKKNFVNNYIFPNSNLDSVFKKIINMKNSKMNVINADNTVWKRMKHKNEFSNEYSIPVISHQNKIDYVNIDDKIFRNKSKIIIPRNLDYNLVLDKEGQYGIHWQARAVIVDKNFNSYKNFLESKVVRILMLESKKWKPQTNFDIIENLPNVDDIIIKNDEDVYSYFNLTQEEIDYIEANV